MESFIAELLEEDSEDELNLLLLSSSSDDDETLSNIINTSGQCLVKPRIENYVENVISKYSAQEFKSHFRMFPSTFEFILGKIGLELVTTSSDSGRKPIPSEKQLLIALWVKGTPDSYRSVCEKFNVGKATALRSVRRVSAVLYRLAPQFIVWPQGSRAINVVSDFERNSGFPGVVGAIDGTHIAINAPNSDAQSYVNRKGMHSIHVQAVCTHNLVFTSMFAGNVGSVHDARVLRLSPVFNFLQRPETYFIGDTHIIGDSAYGINKNLLVPFKDNGHLSEREKNYNYKLSAARVAIERAFGVWKCRWRSILHCLPMTDMEKIPEYLVSLAVLHNICILQDDLVHDHTMEPELQLVDEDNRFNFSEHYEREQGLHKRNLIRVCNNLQIRNYE